MKYLLIVGDGMADYPISELSGKTPLQAAEKPNMDALARKGRNGLLRTIPEGMEPGSEIANLSILGYDPKRYYSGRGPIEAASRGVKLSENAVAFRCNLITEKDGILVDYSAGHITSDEAAKLMKCIQDNFGRLGEIEFHAGVSYRHLLVLAGERFSDGVLCTPPHDVTGVQISKVLPRAKDPAAEYTAAMLRKMILDSKDVLENHPVNLRRKSLGKNLGNMIWPWGPGRKPNMPSFKEKYGLSGAVISAVDLIKGIGACAEMDIVNVPGATGYYDTNYEGKAEYALKALESHDIVFIHVEAPDEAGHAGDYERKIKAIEDLDERLLGRLLSGLREECAIAVLPDHATPVSVKTHTCDPVPFFIYSPSFKADGVECFDEISAKRGSFGLLEGESFMLSLLGQRRFTVFPKTFSSASGKPHSIDCLG